MPKITESFSAESREVWRAWLEEHHATKKEIWLILFKKHVVRPSVSYGEAVEEALCFGWIDGTLKRIDDEKHTVRFTPRRRRSVWSESNKRRVAKMTAEGKMTEAGAVAVQAGRDSGEWDKASSRELDETPPKELEKAFASNPSAAEAWAKLRPSHRKGYIYWVDSAKRPETRSRRAAETVRRIIEGRAPGM